MIITTSDGSFIRPKDDPSVFCTIYDSILASAENIKLHNVPSYIEDLRYWYLCPFNWTKYLSSDNYLMSKDNAMYFDTPIQSYGNRVFLWTYRPDEPSGSVTISRLRVFSTVFTNLNLNFQFRRHEIYGEVLGTPDICSVQWQYEGIRKVHAYVNGVDQGTWFLVDSYPNPIPPTQ